MASSILTTLAGNFRFMAICLTAFCPNEEAAPGSIVVSLPCTAYLCGALIVLYLLP